MLFCEIIAISLSIKCHDDIHYYISILVCSILLSPHEKLLSWFKYLVLPFPNRRGPNQLIKCDFSLQLAIISSKVCCWLGTFLYMPGYKAEYVISVMTSFAIYNIFGQNCFGKEDLRNSKLRITIPRYQGSWGQHGAHPSAPDGPHVGPMNLTIRVTLLESMCEILSVAIHLLVRTTGKDRLTSIKSAPSFVALL